MPILVEKLAGFSLDGSRKAERRTLELDGVPTPVLTNEYWTPRQRQALAIHEVSYRACFKPQLPGFFIELLTAEGDRVYDPFLGRGTTAVEAAARGRCPVGNDVNPLSRVLTAPRLAIPDMDEIERRLAAIPLRAGAKAEIDLAMFYHPRTESELCSLRRYFLEREAAGKLDRADAWLRMIATNRLTGHSKGFFSVYTLPPNQAASPADQRRINALRRQSPEYRDVRAIILKKTRDLLKDMDAPIRARINAAGEKALLLTGDCRRTARIKSGSVALTVTSPPFLRVVEYAKDNWLRCWFNGIDAAKVGQGITMARTPAQWCEVMQQLFDELHRVTKPGGHVAFEVGEVHKGTIKLDELVVPLGRRSGFSCVGILINQQEFTKTANIWGVRNNSLGTNTNRIVLFQKPA